MQLTDSEIEVLTSQLWEAIGNYSAQIATTGELAPSSWLKSAVDNITAALQSAAHPVDERGAFERWVTRNMHESARDFIMRRDDDYADCYADDYIQIRWEAWQARAAQAQADKRDAERFRWIKSSPVGTVRMDRIPAIPSYVHWDHDTSLDAAIDAAMQQTKEG